MTSTLVSIDENRSKINIVITYHPGEELSAWIISRTKGPAKSEGFHARTIARRLAELVSDEVCSAHAQWCGLEIKGYEFQSNIKYLIGDPKGARDVLMFIPMPHCFEEDWERLHRLFRREAQFIVRKHRGRVLTCYMG